MWGDLRNGRRAHNDDDFVGLPEQTQNPAVHDVAASHTAAYDGDSDEKQHVDLTLKTN